MRIDINVDIGEGFPYDEALLAFATSANIGCGEHAGNWQTTLATIDLAKRHGKRIGVHPGYPDRASMGRNLPENPAEPQLVHSLMYQVDRFMAAEPAAYLKPHGAWYNLLINELPGFERVHNHASASLFAILKTHRLPTMLLANCPLAKVLGNHVIREGFADRGYDSTGLLLPRSAQDALLNERNQITDQVLRLASQVDSICIHGDGENCLQIAEWVFAALKDHGYEIGPCT